MLRWKVKEGDEENMSESSLERFTRNYPIPILLAQTLVPILYIVIPTKLADSWLTNDSEKGALNR